MAKNPGPPMILEGIDYNEQIERSLADMWRKLERVNLTSWAAAMRQRRVRELMEREGHLF